MILFLSSIDDESKKRCCFWLADSKIYFLGSRSLAPKDD